MVAETPPTNQLDGLPAPIPLDVLFGNADKRMPSLSPDGKYYAFLADNAEGVTNVFVKPVQFDTTDAIPLLIDAPAQQITNETHRPLAFYSWSKSVTRRRLLYMQDTDGDENFHLYVVDFGLDDATHQAHGTTTCDVTPFGPVTVQAINLSAAHPDTAVIMLNQRDTSLFDAHKVDLTTGAVEMIKENPGDVTGWLVDDELHVVGAFGMNPADGSRVLRVPTSFEDQSTPAEWKPIATWPHGETADILRVTKDAKGVFVKTSVVHSAGNNTGDQVTTNTSRLVVLSLEDGSELDVIAQDPQCDVGSVTFNEETATVEYVEFNYLKPRVEVIDDTVRADVQHLAAQCKGAFSLVSASRDNQTWLFRDCPDDASNKYYIYDRASKQHALLFDSRPELSKYTLVKMEPRVITTSDGEEMVVYLSLPHGIPPTQLPFVLNVHGGPWARDEWGYDAEHQHFCNRGYGCLWVNYRGSTGYGKRWTNLGDRQWGAAMQQDLTDAVHWLIREGLADPERIAIYGASYGGYAALAGLAFTPELFACGIDIVGPSQVKTLFESVPPYWAPLKKLLVLRVGDVENDEQLNRRISPLFHADKITKPLMIAQGANDPRVKQAESDQIAKQLFQNKQQVQYVLYTDEGHGFERHVNRMDFTWRAEQFLAAHLGGRAMPKDDELVKGTSAVEIDAAVL